jgi:hypothetical protein
MQEWLGFLAARARIAGLNSSKCGPASLVPATPGRGRPGTRTDSQSHAKEPARQRVTPPDCAGSSHQNQEGGLKRILGVVEVAQDILADSLHHRTVPFDQGGKGRFIPAAHEELEQLPIALAGNGTDVKEDPKLATRRGVMNIGHGSGSTIRLGFYL